MSEDLSFDMQTRGRVRVLAAGARRVERRRPMSAEESRAAKDVLTQLNHRLSRLEAGGDPELPPKEYGVPRYEVRDRKVL